MTRWPERSESPSDFHARRSDETVRRARRETSCFELFQWMSVCKINLDESIEVETRVEVDERGSFESGVIEVLLMNANPASFRPTPVEKRRF